MSKYKVGDKVVLTVTSTNEMGCLPCYVLNDDLILSKQDIDKYAEPLSNYTEPLERKNENKQKQIEELVDKLHRQAAEITRLLASNAEIQGLNNIICDVCKSDEFLKETAESAKEEGQNEAWELAKKCMLMTDRERETIFGSGHNALYGVLTYFDYKHAAAKVAEWEKAKE